MARTILIIDDEKDMCNLFKKIMSQEGYRVFTAKNGSEGLVKIKRNSPDIVFLDVLMPGMDGIETLRKIRKFKKDLVVIMLTGYSTLSSAKEAMKLGAYDYVSKPFDLRAIKASIEGIFKSEKL